MNRNRQFLAGLIIAGVTGCAWGVEAWAQDCDPAKPATAPAARFKFNEDGTATDSKTGLTWMRCTLGQEWSAGRCGIDYDVFRWEEAANAAQRLNEAGGYAGRADWRLPTAQELSAIAELRCGNPSIDLTVFPATPVTGHWTSEVNARNDKAAWLVHFLYGGGYIGNKNQEWAVRLVRGGK